MALPNGCGSGVAQHESALGNRGVFVLGKLDPRKTPAQRPVPRTALRHLLPEFVASVHLRWSKAHTNMADMHRTPLRTPAPPKFAFPISPGEGRGRDERSRELRT